MDKEEEKKKIRKEQKERRSSNTFDQFWFFRSDWKKKKKEKKKKNPEQEQPNSTQPTNEPKHKPQRPKPNSETTPKKGNNKINAQPRKIQFLRTFGVGPFFFFFGSNQRERYFSMEHGRWKVARRSLHQLPQPPPETFDDDNPQPPKINWSP